jgi:hypothetical protein
MAQTPSVLEGASVRFSAARRYIGPSDGVKMILGIRKSRVAS